jgi:DNA-binding winged helix-turn-helix (wHTH) protein
MRRTLRFDGFEVDLDAHQLYKRGARIRLRDQSFQLLALLVERAGQVVTREELQQRLWRNDVFVDFENSLNTAIARLREALSDSADHPRYIETLPRVGYRFIAPITESAGIPAATAVLRRKTRLIVLPIVNSSGDPSQEYFSDAITDEIITALTAVAPADLGVIARTTSMHYRHTHQDVEQIARELSVDWVVDG